MTRAQIIINCNIYNIREQHELVHTRIAAVIEQIVVCRQRQRHQQKLQK